MNIEVLTDPERPLGMGRPTLLILGRPSCDDCQALYAKLASWEPSRALEILTLNLRASEGEAFLAANPWVAHIDHVPFNVLYVDGEPVAQWTGDDLGRLVASLEALED